MPTSPPRARLSRFLRHLATLAATGSLGLLAGGGLAVGAGRRHFD